MGCGTSHEHEIAIEPFIKAILCPKGILAVEILNGVLEHDTAIMMKMDPYAVLSLSGQKFQTQVMKNAGKAPAFNEKHTWFINSDRITEGRKLEVAVWDSNTGIDNEIGYGIVDVDPIILNKYQNIQQKCYLTYKRQPAGYVNLKLSFQEEFLGVLVLRIMSASIRRKTSSISDMKCVARVTLGEAVEQTEISKDTKESPPHWNEVFKISVVASSMSAKLEVLDKGIGGETLVGDAELDINELVKQPIGEENNPEIHYKDAIAGNVKFIAAFVDLSKAGLENRQRMVEEKIQELAEKEKVVVEREKEQLRKAQAKKEEERRIAEERKREEDQKKKEEEDKKKAAQQPSKKDADQTKDSKVSNDGKKASELNPELNP